MTRDGSDSMGHVSDNLAMTELGAEDSSLDSHPDL
jgi:hypothetical protein